MPFVMLHLNPREVTVEHKGYCHVCREVKQVRFTRAHWVCGRCEQLHRGFALDAALRGASLDCCGPIAAVA